MNNSLKLILSNLVRHNQQVVLVSQRTFSKAVLSTNLKGKKPYNNQTILQDKPKATPQFDIKPLIQDMSQ